MAKETVKTSNGHVCRIEHLKTCSYGQGKIDNLFLITWILRHVCVNLYFLRRYGPEVLSVVPTALR